ncbi:MAG TPA: molybdopterin dinucleotide binding domain-containing protein, partial [Anaerolineaceae bacterium]
ATARGIRDGDVVVLANSMGEARLPARLNDTLMAGVVSLPEGMWVELAADGTAEAPSPNLFTDTQGTAPSSSCVMHAVSVEVRSISSEEPL